MDVRMASAHGTRVRACVRVRVFCGGRRSLSIKYLWDGRRVEGSIVLKQPFAQVFAPKRERERHEIEKGAGRRKTTAVLETGECERASGDTGRALAKRSMSMSWTRTGPGAGESLRRRLAWGRGGGLRTRAGGLAGALVDSVLLKQADTRCTVEGGSDAIRPASRMRGQKEAPTISNKPARILAPTSSRTHALGSVRACALLRVPAQVTLREHFNCSTGVLIPSQSQVKCANARASAFAQRSSLLRFAHAWRLCCTQCAVK
eukprot:3248932-Pleurochrysis_carterae.AAC.1